MNKPIDIIIRAAAVRTGLGSLDATAERLVSAHSAIREPRCFGVAAPWAPFADPRCSTFEHCLGELARESSLHTVITTGRVGFLYAAAKGCSNGLDQLIDNPDIPFEKLDAPVLLHEQATRAAQVLGLTPSLSLVVSNACASGAIALETACDLLAGGWCDQMVVVGFDTVSRFVASGFAALGALSPEPARPFDRDRQGLSLGDGAALAIIERRGPRTCTAVSVASVQSTNDANHRTGPSRTGEGLYRAAAQALARANLCPGNVGAVKCHGTATSYNDAMEAKALFSLFGADCPPCVSLKGSLGHTSGGGSLVECLIAARWLDTLQIPPTVGFRMSGVEEPIGVRPHPQTFTRPVLLCLSAGFGGVNAAVILEKRGPA